VDPERPRQKPIPAHWSQSDRHSRPDTERRRAARQIPATSGMPMGMGGNVATVLFEKHLKFRCAPTPLWPDRDRFILFPRATGPC